MGTTSSKSGITKVVNWFSGKSVKNRTIKLGEINSCNGKFIMNIASYGGMQFFKHIKTEKTGKPKIKITPSSRTDKRFTQQIEEVLDQIEKQMTDNIASKNK